MLSIANIMLMRRGDSVLRRTKESESDDSRRNDSNNVKPLEDELPGEDKEDKASDGQGKGRGVDNAAGGGVREDDTLRDEHNQDRNSNDGRRSVGGVEKPVLHDGSAGPGGT